MQLLFIKFFLFRSIFKCSELGGFTLYIMHEKLIINNSLIMKVTERNGKCNGKKRQR
jgi:hypothetical protein